jgi:hypothetical protein
LHIPETLRFAVRELDEHCCAYCLSPEFLTVTTFEIDDIVPLSAGGQTVIDNLCLACPVCNRHKHVRQTAVDPQTSLKVPLFHPRQQTWAEHFAWNEDRTELNGLTPTGRDTIDVLEMNRPRMANLRRLWVKLGYILGDDVH